MTNKSINYQALTEELDLIIAKLQDQQTSIETAIELYERGVVITNDLRKYLATSKNRLKKISLDYNT